MLVGPSSAQAAIQRGGVTVHRRRCGVLKLLLDLHCRIGDADLQTSYFGDAGYLNRLGEALGGLSDQVWEDFVALFIRRATQQDPGRVTRVPYLYHFPEDLNLYLVLLDSDLCQILRNMMSKWSFIWVRQEKDHF